MSMEYKYDCSNYDNCATPGTNIIGIDQKDFEFLTIGCWGVYCNDGEYQVFKKKKKDLNNEIILRGQKRVAEHIINYSINNRVTDMFLAGDNIYQKGISMNESAANIQAFRESKETLMLSSDSKEDPLHNNDMEIMEVGIWKVYIIMFFIK